MTLSNSVTDRLLVLVPSQTLRSRRAERLLAEFEAQCCPVERWWGCPVLPIARNTLVARGLSLHPDRDLWLWWDDDNWTSLEAVARYVTSALETHGDQLERAWIGTVYATKAQGSERLAPRPDWSRFRGDLPLGNESGAGYYSAEYLAGSGLLHTVRELLRVATKTSARWLWYEQFQGPRIWETRVATLPGCGGVAREYGEDVGLSLAAREAGAQLYIDTRMVLGHDGAMAFWPGDSYAQESGPDDLPFVPRPRWALRGAKHD